MKIKQKIGIDLKKKYNITILMNEDGQFKSLTFR